VPANEIGSISKYRKIFGVGPLGLLIGSVMLGLLWLIDSRFGHAAILGRSWLLRLIGMILIGVWICWHIWCLKTIKKWWRGDQLCTTGPYRFVRHPIYAGGALFGSLGVSLLFNSWVILLLPFLLYTVYWILVRSEEKMMLSVFGEEYRRYAANTGRLFPRFFK
jgi:protein-S-isoprenylcysteine O-methyltransferase Ste14